MYIGDRTLAYSCAKVQSCFYLGDLVTHVGDREIRSVSGRLPDHAGELACMMDDPHDQFPHKVIWCICPDKEDCTVIARNAVIISGWKLNKIYIVFFILHMSFIKMIFWKGKWICLFAVASESALEILTDILDDFNTKFCRLLRMRVDNQAMHGRTGFPVGVFGVLFFVLFVFFFLFHGSLCRVV